MNRRPSAEVEALLEMVRMCQDLHVLPQPGGLRDQDAYFVFLYKHVLLADQERAKLDQSRARTKAH